MKKILLILKELYSPQYKGGIQVFNTFLVKALLELGHTLSIVSINDTRNPSNTLNLNLDLSYRRYNNRDRS